MLPIDEEIQVQTPLERPVLAQRPEKPQKPQRQAKRKAKELPLSVAEIGTEATKADEEIATAQVEREDTEASESETIVVTPAPDEPDIALPDNPHTLANAIVRGLAVANRTGEVGYRAALSFQVQSVVRLLRRGADLESAISRVGAPPQSVQRLLQLGLG